MDGVWETRIQLVSALKEGAASSVMAIIEVKSEVPDVVDVEGACSGEPKNQGSARAAASMSSPILPLSRYA